MEAFEKLEVWQRSSRLSVNVYRMLVDCRDYGFKDQLFRSSLSVPSNIAEGYERGSRQELIRFLGIAKGSCAEMRTQLYIGTEAGILDKPLAMSYIQEAVEISKMLQGLINKLSA
jgi:four helix bundle protein